MKFSVFADLHHYPGVFMGGTDEDLAFIQKRAEDENCAFIIHAGDFTHGPALFPDYVEKYNNFHIPSYHCLGNHDSDKTPYDETLRRYNMPDGHYFFDNGGYRFIVCDPNYYCIDGEYIHYDMATTTSSARTATTCRRNSSNGSAGRSKPHPVRASSSATQVSNVRTA